MYGIVPSRPFGSLEPRFSLVFVPDKVFICNTYPHASKRSFFGDLREQSSAAKFGLDNALVFKRDHGKELAQSLLRPFPVIFFSSFEDEHDFYLVAVMYEFLDLSDLDFHVIFGRTGTEPDLFQIACLLQRALLFHFLLPLIAELVVVNDLSDGRFRVRGDFDEVKFALGCDTQCFGKGEYAEKLSLFVDDTQFGGFNLMVKTKWLFQISVWLMDK